MLLVVHNFESVWQVFEWKKKVNNSISYSCLVKRRDVTAHPDELMLCLQVVRMVMRYHEELRQKEERAKREEQAKLRRVASSIAKEVRAFWSNVEKVTSQQRTYYALSWPDPDADNNEIAIGECIKKLSGNVYGRQSSVMSLYTALVCSPF